MKRFRMTLLALSLILIFLGYNDMKLYLNNKTVQEINIVDLIAGKPHQELMLIKGGYYDLKNAISTSGSIEIESLLVPLTLSPGKQPYNVFVETRNPEVLKLVNKYNFDMDTEYMRNKFYEENKEKFYPQVDVQVMMFSSIVKNQNQVKLIKLVKQVGLKVDENNLIFVAEGKTPPFYRGIFFLIVGVLGMLKAFSLFKKAKQNED
jgi:hypothetical protein